MKATALTANVDARFDTAFPEACAKIGCKPIDLLGVMFSESACSPAAHNRAPAKVKDKKTGELRDSLPSERYNAVGLIQFMPPTLLGLGWRDGYEAFKHLSASQQLPYVVAYFTPWTKDAGEAGWDSAGRLYQACFLPATLKSKSKPDDVLTARKGPLGWAYEANMTFDANGDGAITIGELTDAIHRNARGPRWLELAARVGIELEVDTFDLGDAIAGGTRELDVYLRSVRGVQEALERLGFSVGPHGVDGFYGNDTRAAVLAFQKEHEIGVDGRVGKETRETLALALMTAA